MNSVSWFLYLVDLTNNLREAAGATLIIGGFLVVFGGIMSPVIADLLEIEPTSIWRVAKIAIGAWCAALAIFLVAPSKNTMYAIAASEVGETVLKNENVQGMASDAQKALHQWIKKQIEPEANK